ncbi:MAG: low molecular weight phosphotyrosine protein phosphatase [Flavobacteriales bacterium]|nr:low molecular weight phosphotyrosine protein phosphatase [Flavobacteriales bacterium]
MTKILMVCLGNICRSPLAQGILESKVDSSQVKVDSAGTANYHVGESPDPRSVATARKYGIDISMQRGRQFEVEDFDRFDLIYVMDRSNHRNVLQLARSERDEAKVKLILNEVFPEENREVPDPYYGGDQGFEHVYELLSQASDRIIERI